MPAFNAAQFIEAALNSLIDQSLDSWEAIVVDDASTDSTADLVAAMAAHDDRIRLVQLEQNAGPAAARNRGLEQARGDWIAVLDGDDLMVPGRLLRLTRQAAEVGADIISDNLVSFENGDPRTASPYLALGKSGWLTVERYLAQGALLGNEPDFGYLKPLFRAKAFRDHELRYDERLRVAEDDDLVLRALLAGLRYWLEHAEGYLYRRHGESISYRLLPTHALSMLKVSTERLARLESATHRRALQSRHEAIRRGLGFVLLVEALKARHPWKAAKIALKYPTSLPLLRLPIGAAFRRLVPASPPTVEHPALEQLVRETLKA